MFDVSVRFQVASLLIYVIILIDNFSNKKLPLLSTRYFTALLMFSGLNLMFDFATVYTISNMETVPPWVNHGAHILFIISLDLLIYVMYFYMDKLVKDQRRKLSLFEFVTKVGPTIFCILITLFGDLFYYNDGKIAYSYGMAANTVFMMLIYYMSVIFINTFRYHKQLGFRKRMAFRTGVLIWVIAGIVQSTHPGLLTSNLAQVLMVLFLYLAFENPKEYMDETTNCFNQTALHLMFHERLESNKPFSIYSIVIEDHQRINASYGNYCCNQLMEAIAKKTAQIFGERVYHTRGNILTFLCVGNSEAINKQVTKNLKILCALLNNPIKSGKNYISVRAHIDHIQGHIYGKNVDEIFGIINYMSKQDHGIVENAVMIECDDSTIEKMQRLITLEILIQDAIENDGFDVYYQPIFDVKKGGFCSAEALVRLKDEQTLGYVSPEEFIPIAEQKGMIMDLGRIVFTKVLEFARNANLSELDVEYIEVNLSGIQCVDAQLPIQLKNLMKKYNISPSFINLEITETAMVESGDMLLENMNKLRNIGCSFSMDDFGTGYSNLSKMAEVTYDLVKLDKSLIWPCFEEEKNHNANAILESVIAMLLRLKVHIVAEGVETKEQVDWLSEKGVNYLQGYYFSKPITGENYLKFLQINMNKIDNTECYNL